MLQLSAALNAIEIAIVGLQLPAEHYLVGVGVAGTSTTG
eukprot:SAG22_NODE_16061_length_333_cov_1.769231_1_plen_38_part_01